MAKAKEKEYETNEQRFRNPNPVDGFNRHAAVSSLIAAVAWCWECGVSALDMQLAVACEIERLKAQEKEEVDGKTAKRSAQEGDGPGSREGEEGGAEGF